MQNWWNDTTNTGKANFLEKNLSSATTSTTNIAWAGLGLNLGLCNERLKTNHHQHQALAQGLVNICHSCVHSSLTVQLSISAYSFRRLQFVSPASDTQQWK